MNNINLFTFIHIQWGK